MPGPFPYRVTASVLSSGTPIEFGIPAPVCDVTVSFRGNLETIPALFDSGATRTVLPHRLVALLNLIQLNDDVEVTVANGNKSKRSLYMADLSFLGLSFPRHIVLTLENRHHMLIGRDILNRYKTTLDGPADQFSLQ